MPSVQAGEQSWASWGVRLHDSKGLRHLNLLGTPKSYAFYDFKVESVFFSYISFEDLFTIVLNQKITVTTCKYKGPFMLLLRLLSPCILVSAISKSLHPPPKFSHFWAAEQQLLNSVR